MATHRSNSYQILGVSRQASLDQIRSAFRRQARRFHPDRNQGDLDATRRFRACSDAYALLSNSDRRKAYDAKLLLEETKKLGLRAVAGNYLGERLSWPRAGNDIRVSVNFTFEEACLGVTKEIQTEFHDTCQQCLGTGAKPGGHRSCPECTGRGLKLKSGLLPRPSLCPSCGGRGKRIVIRCDGCQGVGTRLESGSIAVSFPSGVCSGDRKVVRGAGEPGVFGGKSGDLILKAEVENHSLFTRQGRDLFIDTVIDVAAAAVGCSIEVPTLKSFARICVPPATQSGQVFRIRKGGICGGDLLARVVVETPRGLDHRHFRAINEIHALFSEAHYPSTAAYCRKVRDLKRARES